MYLFDVLQWLKSNFKCQNYYSGRADTNDEEYVAIYELPSSDFAPIAVGAGQLLSYDVKVVKFILRYGRNSDIAEKKAKELYNLFLPAFNGTSVSIGEHRVISFRPSTNAPQPLGTDSRGTFEYSFDVIITYER